MESPEDVTNLEKPDKFKLEPLVLSSMICLMMLSGINYAVDMILLSNHTVEVYNQIKNYYSTLIPVIATFLITILSEYKGRKPTLIILSTASIVSTILHAIPNQEICEILGYILQGIVRGGIFSTTFLAISEFCSPKYRFACLIANMAAFTVGFDVTSLLYWLELLNVEAMSEVQLIEEVLALVCFVVVCLGPESPYWLMRNGRLEESRRALLWLRGEGSEVELSSLLEQQNGRGSLRLFCLPLLVGISAISVSIFSNWLICISSACFHDLLDFYPRYTVNLGFTIVFLPIIIVLSYKFNHKSLFIAVSVIPLALSYAFGVWLYFELDDEYYRLMFKYLLLTCRAALASGPFLFGIVLCAEIIPPKYNTYIICVCFIFYHVMDMVSCDMDMPPGFPIYGLAILNTTLALFCLIVFYFLSPETKNKMLLETQELFIRNKDNEFQNQNKI